MVKNRYRVSIDNKMAEVDVFVENLAGLVLIDFEFDSIYEKSNFRMPSVALADVTQEDFIAGGLLAGKKYSDIAPELDKFKYNRLIS